MAAASGSTKSMVLSLSADPSSGANVVFPERCIALARDKNSVTVGRASKVSTKGFVASVDNAWFDSPVMSRLHARFRAAMDNKKVEIIDLGSLHGTFLNGDERVPTYEYRELKIGDTVRFGAPIWQGTKQFIPTTVKVGFQYADHDSTSTFQVPDESDYGSDIDFSGTDDELKQTLVQNTPAKNSSVRISEAKAHIIDLTAAQSDSQVRQVIDLSSPCGSPIRLDDDEESSARVVEGENNRPGIEDEDQCTSPDLGEFSSPNNPDERSGVLGGMTDFTFDDDPHLGTRLSSSSPAHEDYEDERYNSDANNVCFMTDKNGHVDYPSGDSELEDYDEAESSDEDMENDVGDTEDDMEDDMEDMESEEDYTPDDGSLSIPPSTVGWLFSHHHEHFPHPVNDAGDSSPQPSQDPAFPEIAALVASLSPPDVPSSMPANSNKTALKGSTSCSIERLLNKPQSPVLASDQQPNQAIQELAAINSRPQDVDPSKGLYDGPSASSLSTGTTEDPGSLQRKIDFSIARQQNRLALNARKDAGYPTSSVYALCNVDEPAIQPSSYSFAPARHQAVALPEDGADTCRIADPPPSTVPSAFFSPYPPLVPISPPAEVISDRAGPGLYSPLEVSQPPIELPTSLDQQKEAFPCQTPTAMSDPYQHSPKGGNLKRKAENISDVTEEQEQWAAKAVKALSPAPSSLDEEEEQIQRPPEQHVGPMDATMSSEQSGERNSIAEPHIPKRPVKRARMMRVAERLGYAALGGVTAGAMIVGTLIYTAPTFS